MLKGISFIIIPFLLNEQYHSIIDLRGFFRLRDCLPFGYVDYTIAKKKNFDKENLTFL